MTLARLQRIATLAIVIAVITWASAAIRSGRPDAAPLGALLIALGYAAFLGAEFLLLRRSFDASDPVRPRWHELVRAWLREVSLTPLIFLWRQPFRSSAEPDRLSAADRGRRGVLLVHGFLCNRGLWNPWMARLRRAGIPFVALNLEPMFAPINSHDALIGRAVDRLWQTTGLAPIVVAHSMGGLAVRSWLGSRKDACERLHRIVTIATPHRGTRLARCGRLANVRQMRAGSELLSSEAMTTSSPQAARFTCFWSHCDNIVVPTRHAMLDGADNRHLRGTPHMQMAYHPAVFAEVFALLEAREA